MLDQMAKLDDQLKKFSELVYRIQNERKPPSSILVTDAMTSRTTFAFESFLQHFFTVYHQPQSEREIKAVEVFLERILKQKNIHSERAIAFALAAASVCQQSDKIQACALKFRDRMVNQSGCLELDPFSNNESQSDAISFNSITLPCIEAVCEGTDLFPSSFTTKALEREFRESAAYILSERFRFKRFATPAKYNLAYAHSITNFVYELATNIHDHARNFRATDENTHKTKLRNATFWMLKYELFQSASIEKIRERTPLSTPFEEYWDYFDSTLRTDAEYYRKKKPNHIRLAAVTIIDNGPGILEHYKAKIGHKGPNDKKLAREIILEQTSGRARTGAGLGISRAWKAVSGMNGILSVRTNDMWLLLTPQTKDIYALDLPHDLAVDGTSYTILLPTVEEWHDKKRRVKSVRQQ